MELIYTSVGSGVVLFSTSAGKAYATLASARVKMIESILVNKIDGWDDVSEDY
jgi:hypothetical protein